MLYQRAPRAPANPIAVRNANAVLGVAKTIPNELADPTRRPRRMARPMPSRRPTRFAVIAPRIPPMLPSPPMIPSPTSSNPRFRTAYNTKRANKAPENRFEVPVQPAIDQSRRSRNTTRSPSRISFRTERRSDATGVVSGFRMRAMRPAEKKNETPSNAIAAEISGDQDGASSMSIDPYADEEAEEEERKSPERSKHPHLSRACQQDPHGEKLQRQASELIPELRYGLPDPELQEVGMVP